MFDLKAVPELPHHYIIGVAMYGMRHSAEIRGKMYLKFNPVYFHHSDICNVRNAILVSNDKLIKTTQKEASEMFNCRELIISLTGLKFAANSNDATLHHFSSEYKLDDPEEFFESYVKNANTSESIRRALDEARIKSN